MLYARHVGSVGLLTSHESYLSRPRRRRGVIPTKIPDSQMREFSPRNKIPLQAFQLPELADLETLVTRLSCLR